MPTPIDLAACPVVFAGSVRTGTGLHAVAADTAAACASIEALGRTAHHEPRTGTGTDETVDLVDDATYQDDSFLNMPAVQGFS